MKQSRIPKSYFFQIHLKKLFLKQKRANETLKRKNPMRNKRNSF